MGTNFRWNRDYCEHVLGLTWPDPEDPQVHIGKRSAAGLYCWDCKRTLCNSGPSHVHFGSSNWAARCPTCGAEPSREPLDESSAGLELGFAQPRQGRPTGVRSCSSFSWAQDPAAVRATCLARPDEPIIEDEYGRPHTCVGFLDMIEANCPLQFTHSIGDFFC